MVQSPHPDGNEQLPRRFGQYELLERIGQGGMAEVYRAKMTGIGGFEKTVVIKRILPHLSQQDRFVRMFVNEAKLAAQIQHQNVVQVFELGQVEGELYICMEFVHGVDLRKLLYMAEQRNLYLPTWFALHAVRELLSGLAHAHDLTDAENRSIQVIHRDVTPANVFISNQGEVKIADFGIAKAIGESPDTEAGQVKGNVGYMAPEALLGDPIDPRTDIFSAGVVLWETLTQQRLFSGRSNFETARMICDSERPPPSQFNAEVPPELDAITLQAIDADPDRRFGSASEFLSVLVDVLARLKPRLVKADVRETLEVISGRKAPAEEFIMRKVRAPVLVPPLPPSSAETALPIALTPALISTPSVADLTLPAPIPTLRPTSLAAPAPVAPMYSAAPAPTPSSLPPLPAAGLAIPGTSATVAQAPSVWIGSQATLVPEPSLPPHLPSFDLDESMQVIPIATSDLPQTSLASFVTDGRAPTQFDDQAEEIELAVEMPSGRGRIFVRDDRGRISGPYDYTELIGVRSRPIVSVSLDQKSWVDVKSFAQLSGLDRLSPNPFPLRRVTLVGKIEQRSLVSVFGQLNAERATGRLVVMEGGAGSVARREVYVVRGAPTFVYTDHVDLQLPRLLVRHGVVREEQVDELIAQVLTRQEPILDLISWQAFTDINRYWPLMMRDRLVEVFGWGSGRFAFDADAQQTRATPFAKSLLHVVVDAVNRANSPDQLSNLLRPWMNLRLRRAESFNGLVKLLSLGDRQAAVVARIGQRKALSQILTKSGPDTQATMVLTYVLAELGALVEDS